MRREFLLYFAKLLGLLLTPGIVALLLGFGLEAIGISGLWALLFTVPFALWWGWHTADWLE